jgi:hypothetical protein
LADLLEAIFAAPTCCFHEPSIRSVLGMAWDRCWLKRRLSLRGTRRSGGVASFSGVVLKVPLPIGVGKPAPDLEFSDCPATFGRKMVAWCSFDVFIVTPNAAIPNETDSLGLFYCTLI